MKGTASPTVTSDCTLLGIPTSTNIYRGVIMTSDLFAYIKEGFYLEKMRGTVPMSASSSQQHIALIGDLIKERRSM